MTVAELEELQDGVLDSAVKEIRETKGNLPMRIILLALGGEMEVIMFVDAEHANDSMAKHIMEHQVRKRMSRGDIEAVLTVSDMFYAEDMTDAANIVRKAFLLTLQQAGRAGLCTVKETVVVMLESPLFSRIVRQVYTRCEDGEVVLLGEVLREPVKKSWARFGNMFPQAQTSGTVQ